VAEGGQGGPCGVFLLHIDEGTLHSSSGLGHFDEGGVLFSPSTIILIGAPTLPFSEGRKGLLKGHVGDSRAPPRWVTTTGMHPPLHGVRIRTRRRSASNYFDLKNPLG